MWAASRTPRPFSFQRVPDDTLVHFSGFLCCCIIHLEPIRCLPSVIYCMVDNFLHVCLSAEDTIILIKSICRNANVPNTERISTMLHCCQQTLTTVPLTSLSVCKKKPSATAKCFTFSLISLDGTCCYFCTLVPTSSYEVESLQLVSLFPCFHVRGMAFWLILP